MKTVCVDLDGTLAEYTGWRGPEHIGPPLVGAQQLIARLMDAGLRVIIHTCRANPIDPTTGCPRDVEVFRLALSNWWCDNGFPPGLELWTGVGKPVAEAYIDDRAIRVVSNRGYDRLDIDRITDDIIGRQPLTEPKP